MAKPTLTHNNCTVCGSVIKCQFITYTLYATLYSYTYMYMDHGYGMIQSLIISFVYMNGPT